MCKRFGLLTLYPCRTFGSTVWKIFGINLSELANNTSGNQFLEVIGMLIRKWIALIGAICCAASLLSPAAAAEMDCDSVYCFSAGDFSGDEDLVGICLTEVPQGRLMLGDRALRPGDILTAEQVSAMTYTPRRSEADDQAQLCYLPIRADSVGEEAVMTISIRGKENKAPAAEDFAVETYKNLPLEGTLKVSDPEGEAMTFQVVRQPKRGTVELRSDGSFTYTPKKNKVGVDSFVYTATDVSGKVSREATVTVNILKASDAPQYTDTVGLECRFAAEWMKNTGIFVGETLDGNPCFRPDAPVTRGEFTAMLVKALELMEDSSVDYSGYTDAIPAWLRPYVAAAVRCGITAGLPQQETFGAQEIITGAEAAVMLQNALDLSADVTETAAVDADIPEWARYAVEAMAENGMEVGANVPLTRAEAAMILYRASKMTTDQTRFISLEQ